MFQPLNKLLDEELYPDGDPDKEKEEKRLKKKKQESVIKKRNIFELTDHRYS
jgi:hypothetical protein